MYLLYPETRNRSLESIEAPFSSTSPFNWARERSFAEHGDGLAEKGGREAVERKFSVVDVEIEEHVQILSVRLDKSTENCVEVGYQPGILEYLLTLNGGVT